MSRYHNAHEPSGEYYRFPPRPLPMSITRATRDSVRNFAIAQRNSHTSPSRESDSDRQSTPRRRIAVACSRCRKRKIKCSGDQGNGGCVSCKNAGTDPNQCQFLRVNSDSLSCTMPASTEWPYWPNGGGNNTSGSNYNASIGQYSLPVASSFPGASTLSRGQSSGPYSTGPYSSISQKEYCGTYGVNPNDSVYDTYGMQSPQYLLQTPDSQVSTTNYGQPEPTRQWQSTGPLNRYSMSFDNELPSRYATSTVPYNPSLMSPNLTLPDNNLFPAMSSLANSLPTAIPPLSSDRVLPSPRASNIPSNDNPLNSNTFNDLPNLLTSQPSSHKNTVPWGTERLTTGGSTASTSTASSAPSTHLAALSSKSSASPPESQETSAFGYIPLANSPATVAATPATEYTLTPTATSTPTLANMPASSNYADSMARGSHGVGHLYTYSLGTQSKRDINGTGEATLLNGQPYTTLRHVQSRADNGYGARTGSEEVVRGRTSVATGGRR